MIMFLVTWWRWISLIEVGVHLAAMALGSDWFVGKGHDTFAPQGPWIVPKEFYGDPMNDCTRPWSLMA